jgi:hypothetical protein
VDYTAKIEVVDPKILAMTDLDTSIQVRELPELFFEMRKKALAFKDLNQKSYELFLTNFYLDPGECILHGSQQSNFDSKWKCYEDGTFLIEDLLALLNLIPEAYAKERVLDILQNYQLEAALKISTLLELKAQAKYEQRFETDEEKENRICLEYGENN